MGKKQLASLSQWWRKLPMKKLIAVFAVAVALVAVAADAKPKHVFMLMDGSVVKTKPASVFYVEGIASGTGINPTTGVEGGRDADLCSAGGQFALELSTGHIFRPQEGREEIPPFVHGCMRSGAFVPENREVVCFVGRHR
jgi:hypothetical protein